ncbi:MAG TPA: dihydrolipoamide acetyltransferase family protein [Phycisphaerales bacterium]|nr:dihydrolipoamide acetyltransferase family protein [Phycisphaerales bacterium]HMP37518.1 dihydrolipoamide acetyltransferase family protein [Phycisphaerales bacterium]
MGAIKQPADKSHFILPDLGEGVHEAELIKWRVKPGETVKEHQIIAEMETDKALVEVPSPWAGTIAELCGSEGEILKVGNVLVRYAVAGAASAPASASSARSGESRGASKPAAAAASKSNGAADADQDAGTVVGTVSGELTVSDRFARRREEHAAPASAGKALATPAVRGIARRLGVDINAVPASGRGGRVTAGDVESFARGGAPSGKGAAAPVGDGGPSGAVPGFAARAVALPESLPPVSGDGVSQRIPFRGVRRKIADALSVSVRTAVHFTAVEEVDVTALDRKRREYAAVLGQKLSFLPFVMAAVCKALHRHPAINANVDDAKGEILLKGVVNLGCAVDTEHGLMVPVIHNADQRSIVQLGEAIKDLAARCHSRTVAREELQGGTFTISNVGSHGGMFATPIINYPEVGILACGRARERVLARNGAIFAGLVLPLSISCDHRVVDGAEAVRFMNTVAGLLEDPSKLVG